jgi:peptidoglycan hydrolase-like protein with peptidoglycan-binding domain
MFGMLISGFLMSVGGVAGDLAARAAWDKFTKDNPREAQKLTVEMVAGLVRLVQAVLVALGEEVEVDGDLGPETKKALKVFQAKAGLEQIDGVPGPVTMKALAAELLKRSDEETTAAPGGTRAD